MWTDTGSAGSKDPRGDRRFQVRIALIGAAGAVVAAAVGAMIGLKPWSHPSGSPGPSSSSSSQPVTSASPPSPPASSPSSTTPPPQLTYYFNFDGSSEYPCSDEGTIHSVINGPEEPFYFVNDSASFLQIIWLNDNGNREIEDTLPAGGTYSGNFYIGDAWLIASPDATCQGIFVVDSNGEITTRSS